MRYIDLINIFDYIIEDGAKLGGFEKIASHRKLTGCDLGVKMLCDMVEDTRWYIKSNK